MVSGLHINKSFSLIFISHIYIVIQALLCVGLMRRGMVYELERALQVYDGIFCSMSATYDGAVLLWQW